MSLRNKFTGTGIAIVTPFNADRSIDWNSFKKLIEFWIEGKVEYLVVLGKRYCTWRRETKSFFFCE
jgi:4-hydroxy-tetrahydrodipicolinate synthase